MPEIKHQFTGGKMNKDVDERLVPNGEYRDALNIQVSTSEGADVGTAQNILGNQPGCDSSFMNFLDSQTIGSISDEKNDTLYWLVAGPRLDLESLTTTIVSSPPVIPSYGVDRIIRKSPIGCEHVLVDKHTALISIDMNYDQILNQIIIPDTILNDMIVEGMFVTLVSSVDGSTSTTSIITTNQDVSDFVINAVWQEEESTTTSTLQIQSYVGLLAPFSGSYEHPDGNIYITQSDWDNHPQGTNYITQSGAMPGSNVEFTLNGNPNPNPVSSLISNLTENFQMTNAAGLSLDYVKIQLTTNWSANWQAMFPYTDFNGGSNGMDTDTQLLLQISYNHPTSNLTGGIIIPGTSSYINNVTIGQQVTVGYNSPGCVDSFDEITIGPNTGNYLMFYNDCSGTILPPPVSLCPGCDYVTFHTSSNVSGSTVLTLLEPIDSFGFISDDYLYFSKERVLNFNKNQLITGINILDDMLLWTDNNTEPKKINIPRSIEGTGSVGDVHTQLVNNKVSPPLNLNQPIQVPLQEKHITVIKKAPKTSLNLNLTTDRVEGGNYSGIIRVCDDVGPDTSSFIFSSQTIQIRNFTALEEGDVFEIEVESDLNFNSPSINNIDFSVDWRVGDSVVLKEFDESVTGISTGQPPVPISNYRIKGTIQPWGSLNNNQVWGNNFNSATGGVSGGQSPVQVRIKITSIQGFPPVSTGSGPLNYVIDRFDESERLFEFKFPRFSYRYKYEDEEYSSFAPFTEVGFIPGGFNYHPNKGYNLGMTNRVTEIKLMDFLTQDTPLDVVEIDLLYKNDTSPNVYVINTIKPRDLVEAGTLNEWSKNSYSITSETIKSAVESNQLLRPWDNVPRKALAQEVTSNRVVYGNYVQNYNLNVNSEEFYPDFKYIIERDDNPISVAKSIKSLREYQLGVVFIDKYGRETPVISNPSGTFILSKESAATVNRLKVGFKGNTPPGDFQSYKFFIKEVSGEYYNLAMDRFYDAEDGNYWIAFASSDRNKVDIDTFLILKKGPDSNNPVLDKARYKILAIENEAPDFIKTTQLNIGTVTHDLSATDEVDCFGTGVDDAPVKGKNYFHIKKDAIINSTLAKIDEITDDLYVEFGSFGLPSISNRYRITSVTRTFNSSSPPEFNGYAFAMEEEFRSDVNFISDDANGVQPSKINDLTTVTFYKYVVENLPQFDGRFFAKVYADEVFDKTMATSLTIDSDEYRITAQNKLYYLPHHFKGTLDNTGNAVFDNDSPSTFLDDNCTDYSVEFWSVTNCHHWFYWTAWFTNEQDCPDGSLTNCYRTLLERGSQPGEGDWNDVHFIDAGPYTGLNSKHDDGHWENGIHDGPHPNLSYKNGFGVGIKDHADNTSEIDFGYGPILPTEVTSSSPVVSPNLNTGAGQGTNVLGQATVVSGKYSFFEAMSFWDILNLPDTKHIAPWYDMFVSGAQFRWMEDPTRTVYTMTGAREFQNRLNYEANYDANVHAMSRPENHRKNYKMRCFPNHDQWNPTKGTDGIIDGTAVVSTYINNPGVLIPAYSNLTSYSSANNYSVKVESDHFFETVDSAHDNQRWSIVPGMALAKFGSTDINPPVIVNKITPSANGTYQTIEFTGWQNSTVDINFTGGGGDTLVFKQPIFNGFSPNAVKNIETFNPSTYSSSTTKGIMPTGYSMQFIEPIKSKQLMPQDPAIWETEPKEETDLDIYYEISASNPIRLEFDAINTAIPVLSPISSNNGGGSETLFVNGNSSYTGDVITVSESLCIDPLGCLTPSGDYNAPIEVGEIFHVTHIDGVVLGVEIAEILSSSSFRIKKVLYHSYYQLDWHNCYSFGNGVESNRIRDSFNLPFITNGVLASTTLDKPFKEEHRKYGLIYSGIYNSTSGVNNLNQFIQAEDITKDLNPVNGSIQKLHTRDTDLVTLCEDKVLRILANKDALFNADGSTNVTASKRVLGTALAFTGEFGISTNPESFASESYRVYFTDKIRGAVMRLSKDGLTPISMHGMKDWFKDNLKLSNKITGSYDDKKDEYNVTLDITVDEPTTGQTVSFREDVKGWVSFKSFVPENAISCANEYYTFKDGGLWQHHVEMIDLLTGEEINRNTFYNIPNFSYIDFVLNDYAGTMKSFNTLNYEGSQSKVNQFIEYNTFDDNNVSITGTFSDGEYYNLTDKLGWYVESIETNKQKGSIDEFIEKEGKWFNYIKGQTVVSNTDGTITSGFDTANFAIQGIGMLQASAVTSVFGCMCDGFDVECFNNPGVPAFNYNPNATLPDGSCIEIIEGCMDPYASNQGSGVNTDDGSCLYPGCTDPTAFNYGGVGNNNGIFPFANLDDGSCIAVVYGCTDSTFHGLPLSSQGPHLMSNYDATANIDDGSCIPWVFGCTDNTQPDGCGYGVTGACNFDPLATYENNSCTYAIYGCADPLACNYNAAATDDDGSCTYCNDPSADNYDPLATCSNGCNYCVYPSNFLADPASATTTTIDLSFDSANTSGSYMLTVTELSSGTVFFNGAINPYQPGPTMLYTVTGLSPGTLYTFDLYLQCNTTQTATASSTATTLHIPGCMDNTGIGMTPVNVYGTMTTWGACNFNPLATSDDGSCFYDQCTGCTDSGYTEYCGDCWDTVNLIAVGSGGSAYVADDGSCSTLIVNGCMNSTAFNYDPLATVDNGTCYPFIYGCMNTNANNFIPLVNDTAIDVNTDDGSCTYDCGSVDVSINNNNSIDYSVSNTANTMYDQISWVFAYPSGGSITGSNFFGVNSIGNASIGSNGSGVYSITAIFTDSTGAIPDCTQTASVNVVYGCMDNTSCAFNPLANVHNITGIGTSACTVPVAGCMDQNALNYQIGTYDQDCIGVCGGSDVSCCCYASNCVQPDINSFVIDNFFNGNNNTSNSFDVAIADNNPCGGSYGYEVTYRYGTGLNWDWVVPMSIPASVSSYTVQTPNTGIIATGNFTALYPILFDTPPRLFEFKFRTVCDSTGATGPWSNTVAHYII